MFEVMQNIIKYVAEILFAYMFAGLSGLFWLYWITLRRELKKKSNEQKTV